jgi:type III secretion system FlhB-like substrate exporter
MMRTRVLRASKEEKVAVAIGKLLSDFHLDLEKIGFHLAKSIPYTIYRRALEVLASAEFQENEVEKNKLEYRVDRLF